MIPEFNQIQLIDIRILQRRNMVAEINRSIVSSSSLVRIGAVGSASGIICLLPPTHFKNGATNLFFAMTNLAYSSTIVSPIEPVLVRRESILDQN